MEKVDSLTAVRGVAAVTIVAFHLHAAGLIAQPISAHVSLEQAVSLFFVLSGYVLQLTYRNRLKTIGYRNYIGLRFFRVWPAHVVAAGFAVALALPQFIPWARAHYSLADILSYLFLLSAWNPDLNKVWMVNAPSWSISTEIAFYVAFPLLSWWSRARPAALLALLAVFTVGYVALVQVLHSDGLIPSTGVTALVAINPLSRVLEFTIGVVAYEAFSHMRRPGPGRAAVVDTAVVVLLAGSLLAGPVLARLAYEHLGQAFATYFGAASSAIPFALLLGALHRASGPLAQLLSVRPLVILGEWSFALYLVHQPILNWWGTHVVLGETSWISGAILLGLVLLGAAAILHYLVELPAMRWAKRFFRERSTHPLRESSPVPGLQRLPDPPS